MQRDNGLGFRNTVKGFRGSGSGFRDRVHERFSLHFMQLRQEDANNLPALKTWQNSSIGLTSQSTKQVTCFELVMKRDHCNWSSSAKGKKALAVLLMRQNRHYAAKCTKQIYWQILHPEKNVMISTVLQVRECKSPLLLGGKTLGLQCSTNADRVMYCTTNADAVRTADRTCWYGADSGHKFSVRAISNPDLKWQSARLEFKVVIIVKTFKTNPHQLFSCLWKSALLIEKVGMCFRKFVKHAE